MGEALLCLYLHGEAEARVLDSVGPTELGSDKLDRVNLNLFFWGSKNCKYKMKEINSMHFYNKLLK